MKKRYKSVDYVKNSSGFALLLDDAIALTPLGNHYYIQSEPLVKSICEEWRAQKEIIRKETMPMTQIASVALDLAAARRDALTSDLLLYSETDLVCYRAGDTPELKAMQEALDPIVAWAEQRFGMTLIVTDGVMPVKQPAQNREKLVAALQPYDNWKFAALVVAAKPLSSVILTLAFVEGRLDARAAFHLSHLEETFETRKWGKDDDKESRLQKLEEEIVAVEKYLALL